MSEGILEVRRRRRFGVVFADTLFAPGLSLAARATYAALATYAHAHDRTAWPTATRISLDLATSRSTVYAALAELEAAGIITRTRRRSEAGTDLPTLLELHDEAARGSVREADTSVRDTDTGVRDTDTRSVREADTNNRPMNNNARARDDPSAPVVCSRCRYLHPPEERCDAAAARRADAARHAAEGADAVRRAARWKEDPTHE